MDDVKLEDVDRTIDALGLGSGGRRKDKLLVEVLSNTLSALQGFEKGSSREEAHANICAYVAGLSEQEAKQRLEKALQNALESWINTVWLLEFAVEQRALARKDNSSKSGKARAANDKKSVAMSDIEKEWRRRKEAQLRFKAVDFAREMHKAHKGVVTVEGIKNAQTKWQKAYHPSS